MSGPALFGHDLFGDEILPPSRGPVADRFTFPPFSILDGRSGDWQDRKRAWAATGIKGEVGRGNSLTLSGNAAKFDYYPAFEEQKAHLYNEAILLTSVGSASMRVTKQFNAGRKLAKVHQNVLVFCKGDPREAARAAGGAA